MKRPKTPTGHCYHCQIKRGGKHPRHNPDWIGNTMALGNCDGCGAKDVGIAYDCDFDWPDGRKAMVD